MSKPSQRAPARAESIENEALYLVGSSSLASYIEFVRRRAIGGKDMARGDLADQWRNATAAFDALQTSEPGMADKPEVFPLTQRQQAHVKKLVDLETFRQTFAVAPVAFGRVELDKLIVGQKHINLASVNKMAMAMGKKPITNKDLTSICLPLTASDASLEVVLEENGRLILISDTHDARFLGARVVKPADIKPLDVSGHTQLVLALSVGFSTNVLNVVRYGSRMVLNNGYHRAMALRQLGVTHAPCLIQVCKEWQEVGMVGMSEIYNNPEPYFDAARPPLLRDFFNKKLVTTFQTKRLQKEIRLKYEVDTAQFEM